MSEIKRGQNVGERNPFFGKTHTDETKARIRAINTEYQNRPEVKELNILKQPHRTAVKMLDPQSGNEVASFYSLREAKRWVAENTKYKGDISTIKEAIQKQRVSYGYKWVCE